MAQTFGCSLQLQRNSSMTLTSSSYNSTKSLNDIKYEKRVFQRYSSSKNLKAFHKEYQKLAPNQDIVTKIQFVRNNAIQKVHALQNAKHLEALPISILMKQKVKTLVHSLFIDLQMYRKIQSTVRRQKFIVSKLYGWDDRFDRIFFQGEEIKSQVDEQNVEKVFFGGKSGKYDSQVKSIYNKMRLFQGELRNFNSKQMNLNVYLKGKSLRQSIAKFEQKLSTLQNPQHDKSAIALKVKQYIPLKQKISLGRVLGMKHGTEDEDYRIDAFELQQGANFDQLQSILQNGYMSCRSKV